MCTIDRMKSDGVGCIAFFALYPYTVNLHDTRRRQEY